MSNPRLAAIGTAAVAFAAIARGVSLPDEGGGFMIIGALVPAAAALWVWSELGGPAPLRGAIGGAIIGIGVALISHAIVVAFSYAFFLGFAERATDFLDAIDVDPRLTEILKSPWTILFMVELVVVAPLTEEVGKALGGRLQRPTTRKTAFVAGAAAGAGFAVVENLMYASASLWFGQPWTAILLGRSLGAAVHVLASGLVVLGWWEWRDTGDVGRVWRGFLSGVGIHALWNGSLVVLTIADGAYQLTDGTLAFPAIALSYSAALGAVAAGGLFMATRSLRREEEFTIGPRLGDASGVAAWLVVSASLLVPVAMLVLTFPSIYG